MRNIIIFASLIFQASSCVIRNAQGSTAVTNLPSSSVEPYIYVGGGVQKPGRYGSFEGMTVIDAIKGAGGFTDSASHRIRIFHINGRRESIDWDSLDSAHPPILERSDSVSLPKKIW